jgi:CD2 antigen cytoplasmic tail-binding protein 2
VKYDKYIEVITEAVSQLIERGSTNAYHEERERFKRRYRDETGEDWVDKPEMWEFRWADSRDGGSVHGPYEASAMRAWMDQAFFDEDAAEFRLVGEEEWSFEADF